MPDAHCYPINSIKGLNDNSIHDGGQHATTVLPWRIRNTVTVVWDALLYGFKGASLCDNDNAPDLKRAAAKLKKITLGEPAQYGVSRVKYLAC